MSENNNMYDNNGCDNIYGSYRQPGSYQPAGTGGYNPGAASYGNNPYAGRPYNSNPYNSNPYNSNSYGYSNPYNRNPYGYNNPYNGNPYAYNPYMYTPPRKKSISERFNAYFRKKPYNNGTYKTYRYCANSGLYFGIPFIYTTNLKRILYG